MQQTPRVLGQAPPGAHCPRVAGDRHLGDTCGLSGPWGLIPGLLDLALSGWKVHLEKPPVLAERQEARPQEQKATSQLRSPGQGPSFLAQGCPDSPSACARHRPGAFHTHRAVQGCCLAPSSSSANRGPSQCKGSGTRAPVPRARGNSGRGQHGGQHTGTGTGPGQAVLQEVLRPHSFAGSPPEPGTVWTLVWVGPPGASATLKHRWGGGLIQQGHLW